MSSPPLESTPVLSTNRGEQRWFAITDDPNHPKVQAWRAQRIRSSAGVRLIDDRIAYLCTLAAGRDVLDIGVVEHNIESAKSSQWLHGALCKVARRCVGVDVLEKEVGMLRERGYEIYCVDLSRRILDEQFDLVVAGEVIEHLDAPGLFLRNLARMLRPGGRCVVTTPNPWYINAILKNAIKGSTFLESVDHSGWFDAWTICELAERAGLRLESFNGVGGRGARSKLGRLFFRFVKIYTALGLRPTLFAKTIVYELALVPGGNTDDL
jgi:SAM-dependent methyltransferase